MITNFAVHTGGKSKEQLIAELEAIGNEISDAAKQMMFSSEWNPGEKKEDTKFGRVWLRKLGFTNGVTHPNEVWERIEELGHKPCKSWDGPALRLALQDQESGTRLRCLMAPIFIEHRMMSNCIFDLVHYTSQSRICLLANRFYSFPGLETDCTEIVFRLGK